MSQNGHNPHRSNLYKAPRPGKRIREGIINGTLAPANDLQLHFQRTHRRRDTAYDRTYESPSGQQSHSHERYTNRSAAPEHHGRDPWSRGHEGSYLPQIDRSRPYEHVQVRGGERQYRQRSMRRSPPPRSREQDSKRRRSPSPQRNGRHARAQDSSRRSRSPSMRKFRPKGDHFNSHALSPPTASLSRSRPGSAIVPPSPSYPSQVMLTQDIFSPIQYEDEPYDEEHRVQAEELLEEVVEETARKAASSTIVATSSPRRPTAPHEPRILRSSGQASKPTYVYISDQKSSDSSSDEDENGDLKPTSGPVQNSVVTARGYARATQLEATNGAVENTEEQATGVAALNIQRKDFWANEMNRKIQVLIDTSKSAKHLSTRDTAKYLSKIFFIWQQLAGDETKRLALHNKCGPVSLRQLMDVVPTTFEALSVMANLIFLYEGQWQDGSYFQKGLGVDFNNALDGTIDGAALATSTSLDQMLEHNGESDLEQYRYELCDQATHQTGFL
ncbi:hypothetical protein EJ08DRAFT_732568 [Tothia fuscella]|uniref:Uncharacterized protein n=1 Tax=Tothia fuscella TaxID=1048955 RepID=A0A9P4NWL6_9PEZI|nr:hypothetical protein EJ08DRAFT_732568 [Tothia fuscella]